MSGRPLAMPAGLAPGSVLGALAGLAITQRREVTRQPVFGVVLLVGLLIVAMAPALSVFALGDARALVLDLGASSALFFGAFLAATAVAAGTAERLADGTTTLLLTRPVGPLVVLGGGLLGSGLALAEAGLLLGTSLLLASRNGPEHVHWGVAGPALLAVALAVAWGVRASLARRAFAPAAHQAALLLLPLGWLLGLFLGPDGRPAPPDAPDGTALAAAVLATTASIPFAALGTCLATRLPPAGAATLTLIAFVLGSLVQAAEGASGAGAALAVGAALIVGAWAWLVGVAAGEGVAWGIAAVVAPPLAIPALLVTRWQRARGALVPLGLGAALVLFADQVPFALLLGLVVPDLQLYWIADAAYTNTAVPLDYVLLAIGHAALYSLGALGVGAFLLGGRELST